MANIFGLLLGGMLADGLGIAAPFKAAALLIASMTMLQSLRHSKKPVSIA